MSTLINAGLPLVQSLRTVEEQTATKPLKIIIQKIIADVEAGSAFLGGPQAVTRKSSTGSTAA